MKFFDRKEEIAILNEIREKSVDTAQFTVLTGRRRIGKTSLVFHTYGAENILYFFVARKSEKEISSGFAREIEAKLGQPILGEPSSFAMIFEYVLKLSIDRNITLFIDEFQEFFYINKSVYSDMQRLWDLYKDRIKLNLIVGGSINSLMYKIFLNSREPLYQRMTRLIKLKPFGPSVLKKIMSYYKPDYDKDDLLALYSLTGGVAKYVELLIDNKAYTREEMVNFIISDSSPFIEEGRMMLLNEFGKEYTRYFTIMSAISRGYTVRSRIEDKVGEEVSGYLTRLENDYELIGKKQPLLEKSASKNVHYMLADNFLMFWFRYIYNYNYLIEINNYKYLRALILRDFDVFSGYMLERYFREVMIERQAYTRIGSWWDRKGENEIDIIAVDELDRRIEFYEVKRNEEKISINLLRKKALKFLEKNPELADCEETYAGLCMKDM